MGLMPKLPRVPNMRMAIDGFAIIAFAALIGCSNSTQNGVPAREATPTTSTGSASGLSAGISVHLPAKSKVRASRNRSRIMLRHANARSRSYVSPYTTEVDVTVNQSPTVVASIGEGQPNCVTNSDGSVDCTVYVEMPIATDTFVVNAFDSQHRLLSTGTTVYTVNTTSLPNVVVDLAGVVDHGSILPSNLVFQEKQPQSSPTNFQTSSLEIIADDADNFQIDGTFANPVNIVSRNPNATSITTSANVFNTSSDTITVTYAGGTESTGFVFDAVNTTATLTPAEIFLDCAGANQSGDYEFSTKTEVADEFDPASGEHICQVDGPGGSPNEEGPNGGCSVRVVRGQCPNVYDTYSNPFGSGNDWNPVTSSAEPGEAMSLSESFTSQGGPQCIRLYAAPTVGQGHTMRWITYPVPSDLGTTATNGRILFVSYVNPSDELPQGLQSRPQECVN